MGPADNPIPVAHKHHALVESFNHVNSHFVVADAVVSIDDDVSIVHPYCDKKTKRRQGVGVNTEENGNAAR